MLKRRLIPKLQLKKIRIGPQDRSTLVTTLNYDNPVLIGDPVSQARIYQDVAADELILLDLDATPEDRSPNIEVLERIAAEIFMPITVGGGVRKQDDFRLLLSSGADKVSVNTWAVEEPNMIAMAATTFGAQCVVVSIDFRRESDGSYRVWTHGGSRRAGLDPVDWAREAVSLGAGEILLTSIDRDGTRTGLDIDLTRRVVEAVSVPVVAAGGCGLAEHFVEGFTSGHADAVAAGTFFCFKDENPMQTRAQIRNAGIPIRVHR